MPKLPEDINHDHKWTAHWNGPATGNPDHWGASIGIHLLGQSHRQRLGNVLDLQGGKGGRAWYFFQNEGFLENHQVLLDYDSQKLVFLHVPLGKSLDFIPGRLTRKASAGFSSLPKNCSAEAVWVRISPKKLCSPNKVPPFQDISLLLTLPILLNLPEDVCRLQHLLGQSPLSSQDYGGRYSNPGCYSLRICVLLPD